MISDKMQEQLNQRIADELYAWYLYLAIAGYFETLNLKGFGQWMQAQAKEELVHAMKNYKFLVERGGAIALKAIAAPPVKWDSVTAAVQAAYDHEVKVSKIYNQFMDQAVAESDHATAAHIQWFATEQVEEEAQTLDLLNQVKMTKESVGGLLVLDHHLGKRE
jgi:ferritin